MYIWIVYQISSSMYYTVVPLSEEEKPNIWKMKKKERKNFRKQTNDNHEVFVSMKSTYETLRR